MDDVNARPRRIVGVRLRPHKAVSTRVPLEAAPLPKELVLPLESGLSVRDIRPAVRSGQRVLKGQPLVEGGGPLSTWTHASSSGIVRSLESRPVGHMHRREALCAVVDVDGADEPWPELRAPDPTQWATPEQMATALSRAGLAGLGGAAFPTGVKVGATWRRPMRAVVVNGVECEPYISCDDMLMRAAPNDVVAGAIALVELTGADKGFIAVEEDTPEAQQALESAIKLLDDDARLALVALPCIYPAGGERQLIQALTGHEVPSLAHPTDIGYLCQNVGTAAALFRFLKYGDPLTSRVTTVTGGGLEQPRNLEVRFGTKVSDLIDLCGGSAESISSLIMGGSMMGLPLHSDAVPVTRTTNCIIATTEQELAVPTRAEPCISCGDCATVCPAYLMPQELHRAVDRNLFDSLEPLGLFDCIECGCCDVVCPSHIRLTESFRTGKQTYLQAMSHDDRVRWFDARERQKQEGIRRWEDRHSESEEDRNNSQLARRRLKNLVEVIERLGHRLETTDP